MICNNILEAVGHTPMIRLQKMVDADSAQVLVKMEPLNAGGSVKTRTALNMIEQAEKDGVIHKDSIIVEPTSGNQGIGEVLKEKNPNILNQEIYDSIYVVTDAEAIETSKRLAREEGLMGGISGGTNVAAALKLAKKLGPGKTVVTILPDTAERYYSTSLFSE